MKDVLRGALIALILVVGLAVSLAKPVTAGPHEDGLAAYNRSDYATAFIIWRPLAERGDARAQANLGVMYEGGRGVPQDFTEAVKWYRKAADQGYARAQTNLGLMYDKGLGVAQSFTEAVKWYRKAADQGYARAQTNLGTMYYKGWSVSLRISPRR